MGDVLMTLPLLKETLKLNPELKIFFLTKKPFGQLFEGIDGLTVLEVDFDQYRGFFGLYRLGLELKFKYQIDTVCDLHDVLRTKIIRWAMRLKTFTIDKGRREKKLYLKNPVKLKHTTERYLEVFKRLDLNTSLPETFYYESSLDDQKFVENYLATQKLNGLTLIGIAPFSKHFTKIWPLEKLEALISLLSQHHNLRILLFGGGKEEINQLNQLAKKFPICLSIAGQFNFKQELAMIQKLKVMLTMDSGNMHLASLAGVKLLSIWGGTHPDLGFAPMNASNSEIIQIDRNELTCRPCSSFGRADCPLGHFKCMHEISAERVYQRVTSVMIN
jgi:ADP-heptose:LPS heptosyltransferase